MDIKLNWILATTIFSVAWLITFDGIAFARNEIKDLPTKSWTELRKDGLIALSAGNAKEAANKLKGALLLALNGPPGNDEEQKSRKDLTDLFHKLKQDSEVSLYSKLSRTALKAKLAKEFDPNIWFAADGLPRNNVIPKDKEIIGWAKMLEDKTIHIELQSWEKGAELYSIMVYKPEQPQYQKVLDDLKGLNWRKETSLSIHQECGLTQTFGKLYNNQNWIILSTGKPLPALDNRRTLLTSQDKCSHLLLSFTAHL